MIHVPRYVGDAIHHHASDGLALPLLIDGGACSVRGPGSWPGVQGRQPRRGAGQRPAQKILSKSTPKRHFFSIAIIFHVGEKGQFFRVGEKEKGGRAQRAGRRRRRREAARSAVGAAKRRGAAHPRGRVSKRPFLSASFWHPLRFHHIFPASFLPRAGPSKQGRAQAEHRRREALPHTSPVI
jgi:hypothetical protein